MGSVTIDVSARIVGYQDSLKQLQSALSKIDPGTEIGKSLTKAFTNASQQVKELSKNMFPKASNELQIDKILGDVDRVGMALDNVRSMFSGVSLQDLKLNGLTSEISSAIREINTLQSSVTNTMNTGIRDAVSNSTELKSIFTSLGQDITKLTPESGRIALADGLAAAREEAEAAQQVLQKATDKVTSLQDKLNDKKAGSPFNPETFNLKDFTEQLKQTTPDRIFDKDAFSQLRDSMMEAIDSRKLSDDIKSSLKQSFQSAFEGINDGTTVSQFRQTLDNLYQQLSNAGLSDNQIRSIMGTTDPNKIISQLFGFDSKALDAAKDQIINMLAPFREEFTKKDNDMINKLIDKGELEKATEVAIQAITDSQNKVAKTWASGEEVINEAKNKQEEASQKLLEANQKVNTYDKGSASYNQVVTSLMSTVAAQTTKIAQLETQVQQLTQTELSKIQNGGGGSPTSLLKPAIADAQKYKSELNQINSAQTAIGKMQSITQRWFSVYAAVRMVSKAIKTTINTTKELDATITDIAIVTNKSQDQLWGQMPQYTEMARQYGASISGVYKVSQLYYQQGLKQNDVMALSAETLKLARISGLEYSEATDYMTNAVRSFKMEMTDAQVVTDVYSAVAAKSATSVTEIATAMSKTASSAQAVGSSIQNTTAMMAVMIEATRESPENIGSALKSIISRYGELKENKTGIDEEGEEYSLNKVDKALQSVGLTLHDAQGQFRNFDDVIMELAASWDTIDTNTQRYIATVMAGNRQQSRFLALVSSYQRLKELSAEAADSEGASQMQFLKTIDSIEYKSQQLQTSLQSLYTESGIQNLIKDTLDGANNIIETFTSFPKTFDLPLAAIAKFGVQFANIARIVTTTFGLIKAGIATQIDAIRSKGIASAQTAAQQEVEIEKQKNAQIIASEEERQEVAWALHRAGASDELMHKTDAALAGNLGLTPSTAEGTRKGFFSKLKSTKSTKLTAYGGLAASVLGTILTSTSMRMEDTPENRLWKGTSGLLGSTLTGVGLGSMFGPIGMAVGGVIGGISGLVQAIDVWHEDAAEKTKRLEDELKTAKDKNIAKRNEYKTLNNEIQEYKRLSEARFESADAMQEYIDKCNSLAEEHPDLISGYDAEGNAIINLTQAYEKLSMVKKEFTDTEKAEAEAALDSAQDTVAQADKKLGEVAAKKGGKKNNFNAGEARQHIIDAAQASSLELRHAGIKNENELIILENNLAMLAGITEDNYQQVVGGADKDFKQLVKKYQNNEFVGDYFKTLLPYLDIASNIDEIQNEAVGERKKAEDKLAAQAQVSTKSVVDSKIKELLLADEITGQAQSEYLSDLKNSSILMTRSIAKKARAFKSDEANKDKKYFVSEDGEKSQFDQDFDDINKELEDYAKIVGDSGLSKLDDFIAKQGNYTRNEAESLWENQLKGFPKLQQALFDWYDSTLVSPDDIIDTTFDNDSRRRDQNNIGFFIRLRKKTLNKLGTDELSSVMSFYNNILDAIQNDTITGEMGQNITKTYMQLWDAATNMTDPKKSDQVQELLKNNKFTSNEDIQNFVEGLSDLGLTLSDLGLDENIFDSIKFPENFSGRIQAFGEKVSESLTNFDKDLNNATKGMDFSEALKLSEKLGISLTKFRQQGNKFYLDNYEALENYHFEDYDKSLQELKEIRDKELSYLESVDPSSIINELGENWEENLDIKFSDKDFRESLSRNTVDPDRFKVQLQDYFEHSNSNEAFMEYMTRIFGEEYAAAAEASKEALQYSMASSYLANGQIKDFVKITSGDQIRKQAEENVKDELWAEPTNEDVKNALEKETGKTTSASVLKAQIDGINRTRSEVNKQFDQTIAEEESEWEKVDPNEVKAALAKEGKTISDQEYFDIAASYNNRLKELRDRQAEIDKQIEEETNREITPEEIDAIAADLTDSEAIENDEFTKGMLNLIDSLNTGTNQILQDYFDSQKITEDFKAEDYLTPQEQGLKIMAISAYKAYQENSDILDSWIEKLLEKEDGLLSLSEAQARGLDVSEVGIYDQRIFDQKKADVLKKINAVGGGAGAMYDMMATVLDMPSLEETMQQAAQRASDAQDNINNALDDQSDAIANRSNAISNWILETIEKINQDAKERESATYDAAIVKAEEEREETIDGLKAEKAALAEEEAQVAEERASALAPYEGKTYTDKDYEKAAREIASADTVQNKKISEAQFNTMLADLQSQKDQTVAEYLEKEAQLSQAVKEHNEKIIDQETQVLTEEITSKIATSINAGDFSYFKGNLAQFEATARKAYTDTWTSITNSMSEAVSGGSQEIEVTDANKKALERLARQGFLDTTGAAEQVTDENGQHYLQLITGASITWKDLKTKSEEDITNLINSLTLPEKTKSQMLQSWHEALYPDKISEMNSLLSGESFDYSTLDTYFKDFSAITDFGTNLSEYGLALNEVTGKYDIKESAKYFTKLRDDLNKLSLDTTSDEYRDALAQIDSAERQYQAKSTSKLNTAVKDVLDNYDNISEDQYTALQSALSIEQWQEVQQAFTHMADGTHKVNAGQLFDILKGFNLSDIIYDTANTSISNIKDNYLKNITTATSLVTQGTTNQADMQKFIDSAKELGVAVQDAFSYDSLLGAWMLDPQVMANYIRAQGQKLVDEGLLSVEEANKYIDKNVGQMLASQVDIKSFLDSENKQGQARERLAQQFKNLGVKSFDKESEAWEDYFEQAQSLVDSFSEETPQELAQRWAGEAEQRNKFKQQAQDEYIESIISTIEDGGLAAVEIMESIALMSGKELTSADIEAAYRAQVSQIEQASEQLTYGVGSLVSGDAIQMLKDAGYKLEYLGGQNNAVITQVGDIADAYANYYQALKDSGEATLEALNNAKAKVLETKDGRYAEQKVIDALGEANGMTYSTFAQLMTDMGIELTDDLMSSLESSGIIESLGGTKMRIKDFAAFARAMKWDFNSEEYISAFSTYNDGLIEYNKNAKEAVTNELEGLKEIKPGDQLNLTRTEKAFKEYSKNSDSYFEQMEQIYGQNDRAAIEAIKMAQNDTFFQNLQKNLHDYGAHLQDGILSLSEDANLLGVAETLKAAALESGSNMTAELSDMVQSIVESYTNAITKGIEGGMTYAEKEDLIRKGADMGIQHQDTDFYQTAEGWQMSTSAGMAYYNTMAKIDMRQRKKIYDSLSSNLKANNKNYKTATAMLARMGELTRELDELNDLSIQKGDKRKEQLKDEISLLQEMYANTLSHQDDTWNFLSQNPFPESMENALTFWENIGQIDYQMSQWNMGKKVTDMDLFTAGLKEAYEMSQALGESVEYAGMQIGEAEVGGNMTLDRFLESYADLTYYNPKTGKREASANALARMGFDLGQGGINEASATAFAQRNADIIDAFNSFAGSMVGIQKTLKDYSSDEFGHAFEDFLDDQGNFMSGKFLDQMATNNSNYKQFLNFAEKVNINGTTLNKILQNSHNIVEANSDNYKALQGLFKAALTDGIDLEHSYQSVAEALSSNGFEGQVTLYDTTYDIRGGRALFKRKKDTKWTDEQGNEYNSPEEAFDAFNAQDLADLQSQLNNYSQTQSNNGEYNIDLKSGSYKLTINKGKGTFSDEQGNEYSSVQDFQNKKYQEYKSKYEREHRGKEAASQSAWWQDQTSTESAPKFGADTTSLSSRSRQALIDAGLTDAGAIQQQWNKDVAKYGAEGAALEWKAKFNIEPEVNGEEMADGVAEQLGKAVESDPLIANSVADGIAKAFKDDNGEAISKALGEAFKSGLTDFDPDSMQGFADSVNTAITKALTDGQSLSEAINTGLSAAQAATGATEGFPVTIKPELSGDDPLGAIKASLAAQEIPVTIKPQMANGASLTGNDIAPGGVPVDITYVPGEAPEPPEAKPGEGKVTYTNVPPPKLEEQHADGVISWTNDYSIPTGLTASGTITWNNNWSKPVEATGNVGLAHAKSTLMGELGPEMVVSDGRYFVVGQSGPEFVNLADDAIVFNHLQTQSLLEKGTSSTRGKAIINERKAVSYAKGNANGGPAHPHNYGSWSDFFNLWTNPASTTWSTGANMLNNSNGNGAPDKTKITAYIKELERWYNWLQRIAKLEAEINYQETLRSKYASSFTRSGADYYNSQIASLQAMNSELAEQNSLLESAQNYLNNRVEQLNNSNSIWSALYTIDENGQQVYQSEEAQQAYTYLFGQQDTNAPNMSAREQYDWLVAHGFGQYMQFDSSGSEIQFTDDNGNENEQAYQTAVQAAADALARQQEDIQNTIDLIDDTTNSIAELEASQNEILQEMENNQIAVENKVMNAVVEKHEREIELLEDQKDAIEKNNQALIDGLNKQLENERNLYQNQQDQDDLSTLQRQLSILERSGGSASEIASLKDQIESKQYDIYFDTQEDMINNLQEAMDTQIEKLDTQIDLMNETLEYQKEFGLLWGEVNEILDKNPDEIEQFIQDNTKDYWGKSVTDLAKTLRNDLFEIDQFKQLQEDGGIQTLLKRVADKVAPQTKPQTSNNNNNSGGGSSGGSGGGSGGSNSNPIVRYEYQDQGGNHLKIPVHRNGHKDAGKPEAHTGTYANGGKCSKCQHKKRRQEDIRPCRAGVEIKHGSGEKHQNTAPARKVRAIKNHPASKGIQTPRQPAHRFWGKAAFGEREDAQMPKHEMPLDRHDIPDGGDRQVARNKPRLEFIRPWFVKPRAQPAQCQKQHKYQCGKHLRVAWTTESHREYRTNHKCPAAWMA